MDPVIIVLLVLYVLYWVKLIVRLVRARRNGLKFFDSTSNSTIFGVFVALHVVGIIVTGMGFVLHHIMWVAG